MGAGLHEIPSKNLFRVLMNIFSVRYLLVMLGTQGWRSLNWDGPCRAARPLPPYNFLEDSFSISGESYTADHRIV